MNHTAGTAVPSGGPSGRRSFTMASRAALALLNSLFFFSTLVYIHTSLYLRHIDPGASTMDDPAFQASSEFSGPRPGFAFKRGPQGVGYYYDFKQARAVSSSEQQGQGSAGAADAPWRASPAAAAIPAHNTSEQQGQQPNSGSEAAAAAPSADKPSGSGSGAAAGAEGTAAGTGSNPGSNPGSASSGAAKKPPVVLPKSNNPFLKLLKGKKVPAAVEAGGDAKRAKKGVAGALHQRAPSLDVNQQHTAFALQLWVELTTCRVLSKIPCVRQPTAHTPFPTAPVTKLASPPHCIPALPPSSPPSPGLRRRHAIAPRPCRPARPAR
jgi:hypothetical protein